MTVPDSPLDYESVIEFVRNWSADTKNPPYDVNGTLHLMLAALDNLREHATDDELQEIGHSMSDDQRFFLKKIALHGCRITDADIEDKHR